MGRFAVFFCTQKREKKKNMSDQNSSGWIRNFRSVSCPAARAWTSTPFSAMHLTAEQKAKAEQKTAKSLFEKAPVFHYGSARRPSPPPA